MTQSSEEGSESEEAAAGARQKEPGVGAGFQFG